MNFLRSFVLLNFFLHLLCIFQQANAIQAKDVQIKNASDCTPPGTKYPTKINDLVVRVSKNRTFLATGSLTVTEELPTNIELEVILVRCNFDYSGCIQLNSFKIPRICEKVAVKTSFAYIVASGIHPTPICPVKPDIYEIRSDSKFLLDSFLKLPTDGYLWKGKLIFYEKRGLKRVRPLACLNVDLLAKSRKT